MDSSAPVATRAALRVERLTKRYKGKSGPVAAVTDVGFDVVAGETVALLGPNGAGKTTIMKTASGLVIPDAGRVLIDGREPYRDAAALQAVGSLLEGSRNLYWKLTPRENLAYFGAVRALASRRTRGRIEQLLHHFDLLDKADTPVEQLSRGMQQKLAVACAVLHEPAVLLLDEPTVGLDTGSSLQLIALVRQLAAGGMTILLSTHQLDVAESLAHNIVILDRGRIVRVARKEDLIREFSRDRFVIRYEGALAPRVHAAMVARFGAAITEGEILLPIGQDRIYEALDLLRPTPIVEIARHRASLSSIFLQLTGERIQDE
jgi:ABC-2 type transport system ATP-binding protein